MAEDVVKVSADTTGVADALRQIREELLGLRKDAAAVGADVKTATAPLKEMQAQLDETTTSAKKFGETIMENIGKLATAAVAFGAAAVALGALAEAYQWVKQKIEETIKAGLDFNASLETARIGLAATILTFRDLIDSHGKLITGTRAFAEATKIATETQELLRAAAFRTVGTFKDIEHGFEQIYAAASRGTATQREIVQLAETTANWAAAHHVASETAFRGVSMALMGISRAAGQTGAFLRAVGADPATLRGWIQQGTAVQELNARLKEYQHVGELLATTYGGLRSILEDATQQFGRMAAEPIFEELKTQLRAITHELVTVTSTKVTLNPEIVAWFKSIGEAIAGAIRVLAPFVPALVELAGASIKTAATFVSAFAPIVPLLVGMLNAFAGFMDAIGPFGAKLVAWGVMLAGLSTATDLLLLSLGALRAMWIYVAVNTGVASVSFAAATANLVMLNAAADAAVVGLGRMGAALIVANPTAAFLAIGIAQAWAFSKAIDHASEGLADLIVHMRNSDGSFNFKIFFGTKSGAEQDEVKERLQTLGTLKGMIESYEKKANEATSTDLAFARSNYEAAQAAKKLMDELSVHPEKLAATIKAMRDLRVETADTISSHAKVDPHLAEGLDDALRHFREMADKLRTEMAGWGGPMAKILADNKAALAAIDQQLEDAIKKTPQYADELRKAAEEAKRLQNLVGQHAVGVEWDKEFADSITKLKKEYDVAQADLDKWLNEGIKARKAFWADVEQISIRGAETEADKIRDAAQRQLDGLDRTFNNALSKVPMMLAQSLGSGSVLDIVLGLANMDANVEVLSQKMREAMDGIIRTRDAALDVARAKELGDWDAYYAALVAKGRLAGKTEAAARYEAIAPTLKLMKETMTTANEGIKAAWMEAQLALRNEAQITFEFFSTLYQTGAREFEDLFAAVITGRVDTLKDVLLNAWQSIAKGFSKMLSDMLQKWIATQAAMQDTSFIGTNEQGQPMTREPLAGAYGSVMGVSRYVPATGSSGGGFNYAGAAGGAVQGAAVGAGVGSMSGAPGFATGATIGGLIGGILATTILNALMTTLVTTLSSGLVTGTAAGAAAGPLGMIIGAIIGGLIGVLSAPNTEMHVPFTATAGRQEFSDFYGRPQNTAAGQFLEDITNKISTSLAETFLKADPAGAAGLVDDVNGIISRYIKSMDFEIHAGEKEDILKDFEFLTTNQIPKELMHQLFGNQRVTGQNLAGISGASRYDRVLDPDSPITKMLLSIGVTMEKIGELSDQIDVTDPKVFLDRLKNFVAAIVDANAVVAELKKSYGETRSDIIGQQTASPGAQFKAVADQIVAFAQQIPLYVGDDQLAKMKDLNTMAQQYRQGELQALTALIQLEQQWAASVNALRGAMQDAGKGTDWLNADRWARASANLSGQDFNAGRIAHATTPEELMDLANQTRELIAALFQSIFDQLQRGRALQASMADLSRAFGMGTAGQWDAANKNPFRVLNETQASIAEGLETAWHQTGQAQLDTIQQVHEAAQSMYQQQIALLNTIHSNLVEMQRGFASQIQDWQFSLLHNQGDLDKVNQKIVANLNAIAKTTDPAEKARLEAENRALTTYGATINPREQIDWLKARLEEDKAALATAQTPEEIKRLTDEIQKFTNQYVGMFATSGFGAGGLEADPNRAAAIDWAKQFLGTTQAEATAAYKKMEAEIQAHNVEMQRLLDAGTQLLIDNEWHASQAIGRLTAGLNSLDQQTLNKLHQFGEAVLSDSERVWKAIDDAASHLKTAIDGPQYGAVSAIDRLGAAADAAAERLNKLPSGIVNPTAPTNPVTTPTGTPASASAYTADLFRRNGSRLTMRMTG